MLFNTDMHLKKREKKKKEKIFSHNETVKEEKEKKEVFNTGLLIQGLINLGKFANTNL